MSDPLPAPLTEGRKEQILNATGACIARLGLRLRVEDVLQEAGISRATFYRHFDNLDAVLIRLSARAAREMLSSAVAASREAETCGIRRIAHVVAAMADRTLDPPIISLLAESEEMVRLSNLIMLDDDAMAVLAEPMVPLLEEAVSAGALRSDMSITKMIEWLTRNQTSIRYRLPPWAHTLQALQEYAMEFVIPPLLPRSDAGLAPVMDRLDMIQQQIRALAEPN